jgi:hypothetical protein
MTRERLRRLVAILLLAIFSGSGLGLELDELLHPAAQHSGPLGVSHLDPPGGCGAHAEHCALLRSAPARPLVEPGTARIPFIASITTPAGVSRPAPPASVDRDLLHSARPPPPAS